MNKLAIVVSTNKAKFKALPFVGALEENLKTISEIGYNGVEFAVRNPMQVDQEKIADLVKLYNLAAVALGTGQAYGEEGLCFSHKSKRIRKKAVKRICSQIDFAQKLDSLVVIGLIRGNADHKKAYSHIGACLEECLEYASQKQVTMVLEPLCKREALYVTTLKEAVTLIDELRSSNLRILADTYHMAREEPGLGTVGIINSLRKYSSYIGHVHVADFDRVVPGMSRDPAKLNFKQILKRLKEVNYGGFISVECLPKPRPDYVAQDAYSILHPILEVL